MSIQFIRCIDGTRMDVEPLPYIQLPCKPSIMLDWVGPTHTSPPRAETYRRELLRGDYEVFPVYIYETLNTSDAMHMLISNYNPPKP